MAELNPIDLRFNIPSAREQFSQLKQLEDKFASEHSALLKKQWEEEKMHGANVGALKAIHLKQLSELDAKQATQKRSLLDKQFADEKAHSDKVSNYLQSVRIRSTQLAEKENEKLTASHQKELDKQAKAEEAHALKVLKYHQMLVKNSLEQGDNQRGIRELIGAGIKGSGIGGQFGSSIAGISAGALGGTAGIAGSVILIKELGEAGIKANERIEKLRTGLEYTGTAAAHLTGQTNALVASTYTMANSFGVNNQQLQEATAHFLELGGTQEDLARKQQAIILLAEKSHHTLEEAATFAVKGFGEELDMPLKRMGIALDKTLPPAEQFNQFMRQAAPLLVSLKERAGGVSGDLNRLTNEFNQAKDTAGLLLLKAIDPLLKAFNAIAPSIETAGKVIVGTLLPPLGLYWLLAGKSKDETEKFTEATKALSDAQAKGAKSIADETAQLSKEAEKIGIVAAEYIRVKGILDSFDTKRTRLEFLKNEATTVQLSDQQAYGGGWGGYATKSEVLKNLRSQIKETQGEIDKFNTVHGQYDDKTSAKGKSASTIFHEKYRAEIDALQAKLNAQKALEETMVAENLFTKKEGDRAILEDEAHYLELMKKVDTGGYKDLRKISEGYGFDERKAQATLHNDILADKNEQRKYNHILLEEDSKTNLRIFEENNKEMEQQLKDFHKMSSDSLKAFDKEQAAELKKYTDLVKNSIDSELNPLMKSLTDKLPKGIGTFASGLMKIGVDNITKQLFKENDAKDEEVTVNTMTATITSATLNIAGITSQNTGTSFNINSKEAFEKWQAQFLKDNGGSETAFFTPPHEVEESTGKLTPREKATLDYKKSQINGGENKGFFQNLIDVGHAVGHGVDSAVEGMAPLVIPKAVLKQFDLEHGTGEKITADNSTAAKATEAGFTAAISKLGSKGKKGVGDVASVAGSILSVIPRLGILGAAVSGAGALFGSTGIDSVPQYLAAGGQANTIDVNRDWYSGVRFKPKGTDTVPAMLSPGERVLSVSQNNDIVKHLETIARNSANNKVLYSPYDMINSLNQNVNVRNYGVLG